MGGAWCNALEWPDATYQVCVMCICILALCRPKLVDLRAALELVALCICIRPKLVDDLRVLALCRPSSFRDNNAPDPLETPEFSLESLEIIQGSCKIPLGA
jgi:hypothetical protein